LATDEDYSTGSVLTAESAFANLLPPELLPATVGKPIPVIDVNDTIPMIITIQEVGLLAFSHTFY
jgi:hypothetical protein